MHIAPALTAVALAAGPTPVIQTFDFNFAPCRGVVAADNPFHVTTTSDPGRPSTRDVTLGGITISAFADSGSYVGVPSRSGDRVRAGRYTDGYVAVARGHVTLDETGAVATADWLDETRVITLWDGRDFFFREMWQIHVSHYDENTTQPLITNSCTL